MSSTKLKLGFLFGVVSYLCDPSFGRLERRRDMIPHTPLLRNRSPQISSSCSLLDELSCVGYSKVDAASNGPSDQNGTGKECWPECPVCIRTYGQIFFSGVEIISSNPPQVVFTITISQTLSSLPIKAYTVTIGGNDVTQSSTTTPTTTFSTSGARSSVLPNPASTIVISSATTSATVISTPTKTGIPELTTQLNQLTSISHTSPTVTLPASSSTSSANLQTFSNALGNISAPPVFDTGNGDFIVEGDSSFNNEQNALARSCDVQHNDCGNAANADHDASFTVNDCDDQEAQCKANAGS
ncbi:hypothetical protein F5050DRAFT_1806869 [Lentinula boryana]|uniref:Uncharacterized protein n=1 Tax=Lentinula boryana TaxID=40481 RepID=A0ABQ8QFZ5_9AGAR|nr:hypothetical protein F5050DRAFT_1806869 [Lentinula boryana]